MGVPELVASHRVLPAGEGKSSEKVCRCRSNATNSSAQQCLEMLQQAAFQAGLQIQQADGSRLKVFGTNNAVHVSQAETTVTQF